MADDRARRAIAGFSLIELLVVLVVLGILSVIVTATLFGALDRAKQRATMSDMRTVSRALESYAVDNSYLPRDSGGLVALKNELIPYATQVLPTRDHWGHDMLYDLDGGTGAYSLISYGKDGLDGVDYDGADLLDYNGDLVMFNGVFVSAPE